MFLADPSLWEVVKKQYIFKLKAYIDSYTALVGIHILGILFSLGGVGSMGGGGNAIDFQMRIFSSDIVLAFTAIWAFTTAITLTTRPYRNQEFTFVGNRLSSSLANILFLLTTSCAAGILSMLSGGLLNLLAVWFYDAPVYNILSGPWELLAGIAVAVFYLILASALGYLVGSLVQIHKIFIVILSAILLGMMVIQEPLNNGSSYLIELFAFFGKEEMLPLFILKAAGAAAVLFWAAVAILNRMEAKR